jgi:non-specific serine/threonine protein kinase
VRAAPARRASHSVEPFPDGAWLVELASLSDPGLVLQTLARALGLIEQPGKRLIDTITDHLASKRLLLVLDNAEHLLDACVQLIDRILRCSSRVAMLVTSRQRLGLAGERTYRVPSLTVPDRTEQLAPERLSFYEGVRLFVERAQLLRPDFEVTASNARAVGSVCYQLDGIPLAIELAAPRLTAMSVEELSQRLDQRFALLTGGSRTALPRHRTLRSTIDWSYDLLTDVEQAMLRRVSVFAGGWTLAAAEHVCPGDGIEKSDAIGLLTSLADKNLLLTEEHEGATRYRMLETIRQYSLDRLRETGEEARWRHRHFAWVLALTEEAFEPLSGPDQGPWLDRLARELDNFRAALGWAIEQKLPDALRMAPGLTRWWVRRAHVTEARERFSRLLDVIPRDQAKWDRGRALSAIGNLALHQGELDEAEPLFRESLALFHEIGDARRVSSVQTNLALLALARGQYADAEPLLVDCATLARALGNPQLLAVNLGNLAIVVHARGDGEKAASLFEESLTLARDVGDSFLTSEVLAARGRAACRDGNLESAEASFVESVTLAAELTDPVAAVEALEGFAELAVAKQAPKRAATILGAAARLREEMGLPIPVREEREHKRVAAAARAVLGDVAFDQAWREGHAIKLEEAVRYALNGQLAEGT